MVKRLDTFEHLPWFITPLHSPTLSVTLFAQAFLHPLCVHTRDAQDWPFDEVPVYFCVLRNHQVFVNRVGQYL